MRLFTDAGRKTLAGGKASTQPFWALKDINLDINAGEVVGVIGSNGAGKSTLLKILSRITEPTTGEVRVRGRMASLLEVGTGFHPELTGRENIFLNGTILGMERTEIRRKFDEIVAFAEIDEFLDTPVTLSSGMYVRLAFAVSAHLAPEILVVDEVLAVGDVSFQRKCLGKMGEVSRQGRTVIFVSHNMAAVENLCTRGVVLRRGEMVFNGSAKDAIQSYMSGITMNNSNIGQQRELGWRFQRPNQPHRATTGDATAGRPWKSAGNTAFHGAAGADCNSSLFQAAHQGHRDWCWI